MPIFLIKKLKQQFVGFECPSAFVHPQQLPVVLAHVLVNLAVSLLLRFGLFDFLFVYLIKQLRFFPILVIFLSLFFKNLVMSENFVYIPNWNFWDGLMLKFKLDQVWVTSSTFDVKCLNFYIFQIDAIFISFYLRIRFLWTRISFFLFFTDRILTETLKSWLVLIFHFFGLF